MPPETEICSPVIQAASSEARNTAALAISSGLPRRPSGVLAINIFSYSLPAITPAAVAPSVSVAPGKIELIRIFLAPSSFDKETVMASNAALVAEYNAADGNGILLAPELILIILPPLPTNSFTAAWIVNIGPSTFTLKLLWKVSADINSIGA